jgi:hypothetical protein
MEQVDAYGVLAVVLFRSQYRRIYALILSTPALGNTDFNENECFSPPEEHRERNHQKKGEPTDKRAATWRTYCCMPPPQRASCREVWAVVRQGDHWSYHVTKTCFSGGMAERVELSDKDAIMHFFLISNMFLRLLSVEQTPYKYGGDTL